ncbi:MAG: hypothetical protein ACLRSA_06205 [Streptococcus salivarius]
MSIRQGPLQSRGMEVTEIRPAKDPHDLEALAQYVEASMDHKRYHGCDPKISQDSSQPAIGRLLNASPYVQEKYGAIALNRGSMY